jgi:hypothetical protein
MSGKDTSFNSDIVAQLALVGQTNEVEEELPVDYPFTEEVALNLY